MDSPVTDFIPHRQSMCLVRSIVEIDYHKGVIRAVVEESWPTCVQGSVDPILLVEVFAQSAGVLAGWKKRKTQQQGARGWLVGIRQAEISGQPIPVHTILDCHVQADYQMENYAVFKGTIESARGNLARLVIQTFQPEDAFWNEAEYD